MAEFKKKTIAEIKTFLDRKAELSPEEEDLLRADGRKGVAELLENHTRRKEAREREEKRLRGMLIEEEILIKKGFRAVAGVDEAGRGPLAGPVIAAAVVLEPGVLINGLRDSKQLSARARNKIFDQVILRARGYGIAGANREEIDDLNIHAASLLAMRRALGKLPIKPDYVLVDGGFPIRDCPFEQKAIKGGDTLSMSIAAASVLAKVSRDNMMLGLHQKYPHYGFNRNMGYGTAEHREAISRYGLCPAHRRSFRLF